MTINHHATTRIDCAALLLDVDGTLVDSTAVVERVWRTWSQEYGVDIDALLRVCHGRRAEDTVQEFIAPQHAAAAVRRLEDLEIDDLDGVVACPGAGELIEELAGGRGPRWALVTSGSLPLVTARMKAAGLPLPEVVVTAESVVHGKPAPQGYLLAAERIGVPAPACVVIEDAPAGVAAGLAAGATVIAVTTTFPASAFDVAHHVAESLHQISPQPGALALALG